VLHSPHLSGRARALAIGAAVATATISAVPVAARAAAAPTTHLLPGAVAGGLAHLSSTAVPATTAMQVGLTLPGAPQAELDAAYRDIYTPGSAHFHQFLTEDEVAQRFGARPADAAAAVAYATRGGLRAVFTSPDHEYVLLQGSAAQVQRTFGVHLRSFRNGTSTFLANVDAPRAPLSVDGVLGLDSRLKSQVFAHPAAAHPVAAHPAAGQLAPGRPAQDTCAGPACLGLTTPQDLWSIYDQPTDLAAPAADFGQGQQMAVLGEGAVVGPLADLRAFEKEFKLPQIPVRIASVGDDFKDTSGSGEWDIDMQASTGMAPKAAGETLYFAKDLSDSAVLADFVAWGTDRNGPMQANASFGECEQDPTSTPGYDNSPTAAVLAGSAGVAFTRGSERALQQAALAGKTLFSSTGDTGASCPVVATSVNGVGNELVPETEYPASSRFVVAVGGTVLYGSPNTATGSTSNSSRVMETAWPYTGGGDTLYIPQPGYQKGISLLDHLNCIAQPTGAPYPSPTPCRGVPDVAAQSGDVISNGYAVTMAGTNDQAGGGTSLSSPLWMGMWTRIQAAAPPTRSGRYSLGFANETLYAIGKRPAQDAADFFDIGGGPPSSPVTTNGLYTSLPRSQLDPSGWDFVSGLGAPDVTHLGRDATHNPTLRPTRNVSAGPPHDCGQAGLPPCQHASCTAGGPLWTSPAHVASDQLGNQDPQLSLLAGRMGRSADGGSLLVTVVLDDLSKTVPLGATGAAWYSEWLYKGTTYFASAELGPDGSVTYGDGTFASTGGYQQANTDRGSFRAGTNGTITVIVPLAHVGNPGRGSVLSQPAAKTFIEEGVPPTAAGGSTGALLAVDRGGPRCDYRM